GRSRPGGDAAHGIPARSDPPGDSGTCDPQRCCGWIFRRTGRRFQYERRPAVTTRETTSYGQFCPIAMASEVLCRRWTTLVLREMLCGSTQFNDLRRGLPRMSPALLSTRLRELTEAGLLERRG